MITVSILGSGNVATHLIDAFSKTTNVKITQIYSRNLEGAQQFKNKANIINDLQDLMPVDVVIIAISDDEISKFSHKINSKSLVVHTSGSISMNDLNGNLNKGVFYPLQTFSREKNIDFKTIPICLEADSKDSLTKLHKLASAISNEVYIIDSNQRKKLHLAAVFVNNFTNHLYEIGNSICEEYSVPFEILHPLIKETANKIKKISPNKAQTGPAKRNDNKTIAKHLAQLSKSKQEIYSVLTKSIKNTFN